MKARTRFAVVAGLAALFTQVPAVVGAQAGNNANTPTKTTVSGGDVADPVRMDTGAVNALTRMGNYLRTLNKFEVKADFSREEVLTDGQKVQFTGTASALADRPTKLLAEFIDERRHRVFMFNGSDFTLWAPRQKYYSTVSLPGTIAQLVDTLDDRFAIETPLVDLFRWGTADMKNELTGAKDLGSAVIDGTTCDHYAFRQPGADWEVWIQSGEFALPRKIVINTLTDEARPQYVAEYTWNLAPSFNDDAFTFKAPDGAQKIKLMDIKELKAKGKGGN